MDWYSIFKAIVLGLVEGITEFLPVSSTGHLIVVGDWLAFSTEQAKTFDVFIQLGAILAIVWLYREKLLELALTWHERPETRRLILGLLVAFLPAAIVGFLAYGWIKEYLFGPVTVSAAVLVGGIVILLIERANPRTHIHDMDRLPMRTALGIGLAQVLSLFPGVSRSGATIMGAYALGCSRTVAAEFSFFLAIPIIAAAGLYDLWGSRSILSASDVPVFAVGFLVSFVSALVVVKLFLRFLTSHTFVPFGWYRIIVGGLLLIYFMVLA